MAALPHVAPVDPALAAMLRGRLDAKTKPPGSLGRLEDLAVQVALAQHTDRPAIAEPAILVFAADHGVVDEGVSAWPRSVTAEMVRNMLAGGAAINAIAAAVGCRVTVVDAGVAADLSDLAGLVDRKVAPGTANLVRGPAMSVAQCEQALAAGSDLAVQHVGRGATVVGLGDMGIGNTSAAALIMSLMLGRPLRECVGAGAGLDDVGIAHKRAVLGRARRRVTASLGGIAPGSPSGARRVLAECGGFEIAMMAGAMIGAASCRAPVLVDGFIAGAAALAARALAPGLDPYLVWAHRSAERGHARLLAALGVTPLLDLGMRLGEGSGGALAVPLLRAAVAVLNDMASFDEAGVSGRG